MEAAAQPAALGLRLAETGESQPAPPVLERVLLWLRRDLRLDDNPALSAAVAAVAARGGAVVPVFIWSPEEEGQFQPGKSSRWWLQKSLRHLEAQLERLGSRLLVRRSHSSLDALVKLVGETGADGCFFNHMYDPISMVRDEAVKARLRQLDIHVESFGGDLLFEPRDVLCAETGEPYTSHAAFWGHVRGQLDKVSLPLPAPVNLPEVPADVLAAGAEGEGEGLEGLQFLSQEEEESCENLDGTWVPGEHSAMQRWHQFLQFGILGYAQEANKRHRDNTSKLSPHMHFGEISVRRMYLMSKNLEWQLKCTGQPVQCIEDFYRSMSFREYSRYLSYHFPYTHERPMLEHLRACPWKYDYSLFQAWTKGLTGIPIIDAGMQQMWSTGWLDNRMRVLCGSFLVKNLLLPWQWGLKHFWDSLLDADLECDALGWQYVSGCLSDAHPFDEMVDFETESLKYDEKGGYIRRWLPMLSRLPNKYIHAPWLAPKRVLKQAGIELGISYPNPVIGFAESQQQLLEAAKVMANKQSGDPHGPWRAPTTNAGPPSPSCDEEVLQEPSAPEEGDCRSESCVETNKRKKGAKGEGSGRGGDSGSDTGTQEMFQPKKKGAAEPTAEEAGKGKKRPKVAT